MSMPAGVWYLATVTATADPSDSSTRVYKGGGGQGRKATVRCEVDSKGQGGTLGHAEQPI
jgi:hypothetical protein